jgi:hypothetical protein
MAHVDTSGNVMDFRTYDSIPSIDIGYQITPVNGGFYIAGSSIWLENKFALVYDTLNVSTGIIENPSSGLRIYPNPLPAGSTLRIKNTADFTWISIFDIAGKIILKQKLSTGENAIYLSENFSEGVYLISLEKHNLAVTGKLILTSITH